MRPERSEMVEDQDDEAPARKVNPASPSPQTDTPEGHSRQILVRLPWVAHPPVYLGACGEYAGSLRVSTPLLWTHIANRLRSRG